MLMAISRQRIRHDGFDSDSWPNKKGLHLPEACTWKDVPTRPATLPSHPYAPRGHASKSKHKNHVDIRYRINVFLTCTSIRISKSQTWKRACSYVVYDPLTNICIPINVRMDVFFRPTQSNSNNAASHHSPPCHIILLHHHSIDIPPLHCTAAGGR